VFAEKVSNLQNPEQSEINAGVKEDAYIRLLPVGRRKTRKLQQKGKTALWGDVPAAKSEGARGPGPEAAL
jgi:hypothetical protein